VRAQIREALRRSEILAPAAAARLAVQALGAGLEEEAIPFLSAHLHRYPDDPSLWQLLGLAHRGLEDLAPALTALGRAAALAPRNALIVHGHARATLEAGLPAAALFDQAQALAPSDHAVRRGHAAACFAQGDVDGACAVLEAGIARAPGWVEGHQALARLRWQAGDHDHYVGRFARALKDRQDDLALWNGYFDLLLEGRDYDGLARAIASARAALGDRADFAIADTILAAESGRTATAERLLASLSPQYPERLALFHVRHELRAQRIDAAARVAEGYHATLGGADLWPYLAVAWRILGDARWEWLESDPRLIGVYDLAEEIESLPALAARLRTLHTATRQPLEQSLRGGTQTDGVLFARIDPEITALRSVIRRAVQRHAEQLPPFDPRHPTLAGARAPIRFAGSWSVRLTSQGFHANHVHPRGWLSSAFYVALPESLGEADHAGWLSFGEVSELGLDVKPFRLVEPKAGRLALFPSTMWHGTRPFRDGERLTVAFDVAPPQD
jgi:tetratricopeptide (TPR) repeat protein